MPVPAAAEPGQPDRLGRVHRAGRVRQQPDPGRDEVEDVALAGPVQVHPPQRHRDDLGAAGQHGVRASPRAPRTCRCRPAAGWPAARPATTNGSSCISGSSPRGHYPDRVLRVASRPARLSARGGGLPGTCCPWYGGAARPDRNSVAGKRRLYGRWVSQRDGRAHVDTTETSADGFATTLRRRRLVARLSQERLAELSGLSARAIRDIERGRVARPRPESVRLIGLALGLAGAELAEFRRLAEEDYWTDREPGLVPRPAVAQLPAAVSGFTGRKDDLDQLDRLLLDPRDPAGGGRIVLVSGTAGVGKTALAVQLGAPGRRPVPGRPALRRPARLRPGPAGGRRRTRWPASCARSAWPAATFPSTWPSGRRAYRTALSGPADAGRAGQRRRRRPGPPAAARRGLLPGAGDQPGRAGRAGRPGRRPPHRRWTCCPRPTPSTLLPRC